MHINFLGTGSAGGVPLYGCECAACERASTDATFQRRPCCVSIKSTKAQILMDAGVHDIGQRFPPGSLSAMLLTHFHPDHVQGLFHWRWGCADPLPVYTPPDSEGCADLYKHPGFLKFTPLEKFVPIHIDDLLITPLPLIHSKVCFGYAIESEAGAKFAYLTDTAGLPPKTLSFLRDWRADGLALDCSYPPLSSECKNHNDWNLANELIDAINPKQAWLTHISHQVDTWLMEDPHATSTQVKIARDGETVWVGG